MKLIDYLKLSKLDDEAFAASIGCSASAVRKWKYGERIPRRHTLTRIESATNGAVTVADFFNPSMSHLSSPILEVA